MVEITCYGGVEEIGGNKILLEDGETRIWLDFGMAFGQYNDYFEEFMRPRGRHTGLKDFFEMGLAPDLNGLYAPDLLQLTGRETEEPAFDAVLLSHAHDDHAKYISFLHPDIPVYMGEVTYEIRRSLEQMGQTEITNRVCSYRERDEDGKLTDTPVERKIETFRHGARFDIGNVTVEPMRVDHSIPAAYGFILHTSDGPFVYTGDLRLHGRNGSWTRRFVEKARDADPAAVLAEGTRITDTDKAGESEQQVRETIQETTVDTDGLVVVDYSYKDLDRFRSLVRVAEKTGRKLVVGPRAAYLYETYAKHIDDAPELDNVYYHLKQKSRFSDWEEAYYESGSRGMSAEDIGKQKDQLILGFNQWKLNELIDIQPRSATYIRSMSEPYNEEMALDEERARNWIDFYGMNWVRAHCSGHAPGQDLKQIITDIAADTIIPIHTEHPEAFTELGNVQEPVQATEMQIGEHAKKTVM